MKRTLLVACVPITEIPRPRTDRLPVAGIRCVRKLYLQRRGARDGVRDEIGRRQGHLHHRAIGAAGAAVRQQRPAVERLHIADVDTAAAAAERAAVGRAAVGRNAACVGQEIAGKVDAAAGTTPIAVPGIHAVRGQIAVDGDRVGGIHAKHAAARAALACAATAAGVHGFEIGPVGRPAARPAAHAAVAAAGIPVCRSARPRAGRITATIGTNRTQWADSQVPGIDCEIADENTAIVDGQVGAGECYLRKWQRFAAVDTQGRGARHQKVAFGTERHVTFIGGCGRIPNRDIAVNDGLDIIGLEPPCGTRDEIEHRTVVRMLEEADGAWFAAVRPAVSGSGQRVGAGCRIDGDTAAAAAVITAGAVTAICDEVPHSSQFVCGDVDAATRPCAVTRILGSRTHEAVDCQRTADIEPNRAAAVAARVAAAAATLDRRNRRTIGLRAGSAAAAVTAADVPIRGAAGPFIGTVAATVGGQMAG